MTWINGPASVRGPTVDVLMLSLRSTGGDCASRMSQLGFVTPSTGTFSSVNLCGDVEMCRDEQYIPYAVHLLVGGKQARYWLHARGQCVDETGPRVCEQRFEELGVDVVPFAREERFVPGIVRSCTWLAVDFLRQNEG